MSLKAHIIKSLGNNKDVANRYETVSAIWPKMGISNGSTQTDKKTKILTVIKTKQIRTAYDDRQSVIQIPLENFYEYLKLVDDLEEPAVIHEEDKDDADNVLTSPELFSSPVVSVASQSPPSSGGFNQVVSATTGIHDNIIVHDGNADLYDELMGDLGDDD